MPGEDEEEIKDSLAAANETSLASAVISELDFFRIQRIQKKITEGHQRLLLTEKFGKSFVELCNSLWGSDKSNVTPSQQ